MKTESGISLLEVLIATLITAIIAIIILNEIRTAKTAIDKVKNENFLQQTTDRILSLLEPKTSGRWHAFNSLKISTPNEILKSYPKLKISNNSKIISFLDFHASFFLAPMVNSAGLLCLISLSNDLLPSPNTLNYLLFSKQSWSEAEVKLQKKKSSQCTSAYEIKSIKKYDSPFNNGDEKTDFILLPLRNSFSIYLDKSKTLRRIEHASSNNQPIEYKLEGLEFSADENFIIGKLKIANTERKFYLKNEQLLSSLELFAILKDLNQ
jgi:hypothetical protein